MQVDWTRFGSYSGPRVRGSVRFLPADLSDHWSRVLWLTSQVESGGLFGNITMYDGTAVTAGLHQAIAVYPRELASEDFNAKDDQGSLFSLLRAIEMVPDFPERENLWDALRDCNWFVGRDGTLRYWEDSSVRVAHRKVEVSAGDPVYGWGIREEFTPGQGRTPKFGPFWEKSAKWAGLFSKVFDNPKSFSAQIQFGLEHFEHQAKTRYRPLGKMSVADLVYGGNVSRYTPPSPDIDLAMCVFWSHSVNAPAHAFRILAEAKKTSTPDQFPGKLLHALGSLRFGRWHFSNKGGRWSRTRLAAKDSGLWPEELFDVSGIMPETM